MDLEKSTVVITRSKTLYNPTALDEIISQAVITCADIPQAIPVFAGGEVIGLVLGTNDGSGRVFYKSITHRQWCGYHSYDDLDAECKSGKYNKCFFRKASTDIAGVSLWQDVWPEAGVPAAGDYSGTAATARQFDNTTVGSMNLGPQVDSSGSTKHLLGWKIVGVPGTNSLGFNLIIYDRVISYDAEVQSTGTTTMTNTNTAQRYAGTGQSGMQILVTTNLNALGATTSNLTSVHYTNQAGSTAKSVSTAYTLPFYTSAPSGLPSTVVCPHFVSVPMSISPFLPLAAGDQGVRKIEDYAASANNTGTFCMALVRPVGYMWTQGSLIANRVDYPRTLHVLERLYDGACLSYLWYSGVSNTASMQGYLQIGWG